jgi:O-methyltransferase
MIVDSNIKGSFAEVGVYKGDTAVILNKYAKKRNLYLFDTFEGFSQKDLILEQLDENNIDNFNDTSIDYIMEKFTYFKGYGKIKIRKGYFPQTAKDINKKFAFVHLDADLKEPIQQGLSFFWPKLTKGGIIVIHDYTSKKYPGVKIVVDKFCKKRKIFIYTLMGTNVGSAVIMKS